MDSLEDFSDDEVMNAESPNKEDDVMRCAEALCDGASASKSVASPEEEGDILTCEKNSSEKEESLEIANVATVLEPTFHDFFKATPPADEILEAKATLIINNLQKPIGMCLLSNGNIAVSSTEDNAVRIFSAEGKFLSQARNGRELRRPSDLLALPDGRFLVRDDGPSIQVYDEDGVFLSCLGAGAIGKCFGLATDGKGTIYTVNQRRTYARTCPTKEGETDVFLINLESGKLERRMPLDDAIPNVEKSKCRFLYYSDGKLYIVDLGSDLIYVMDVARVAVRSFGGTGSRPGQFSDPAGIVVDREGTILVADARNHRLQLFDRKRRFLGEVKVDKKLRRPSAIAVDLLAEQPSIYVLNLWLNCLVKYTLVKKN